MEHIIQITPRSGKLIEIHRSTKNEETTTLFASPFFSLGEAAQYLGLGLTYTRQLISHEILNKSHAGKRPFHIDDLNYAADYMKVNRELMDKIFTRDLVKKGTKKDAQRN